MVGTQYLLAEGKKEGRKEGKANQEARKQWPDVSSEIR